MLTNTDKRLFDGEWFTYDLLDNGVTVLQEYKDGVTILPFDFSRTDGKYYYCLFEQMNATGFDKPVLCSLTGSMDHGEDPTRTALRELREESGFVVRQDSMIALTKNYVHTYKACTKKTWMFAANLTNHVQVDAIGDGSTIEAEAYCRWVTADELMASQCTLLLATYGLLHKLLAKENLSGIEVPQDA